MVTIKREKKDEGDNQAREKKRVAITREKKEKGDNQAREKRNVAKKARETTDLAVCGAEGVVRRVDEHAAGLVLLLLLATAVEAQGQVETTLVSLPRHLAGNMVV